MFFAVSGDVHPFAARQEPKPVINEVAPCCVQIVTAASKRPAHGLDDGQPTAASRYHTRSRFLPAGLAPEQGYRSGRFWSSAASAPSSPDPRNRWGAAGSAALAPRGLALDVMIPDPGSAEGIALGNSIVAYVMQNAARFGIQDAIWRGVYYTPGGSQASRLGHYDHVHVTTLGGGYPTGDEVYLR